MSVAARRGRRAPRAPVPSIVSRCRCATPTRARADYMTQARLVARRSLNVLRARLGPGAGRQPASSDGSALGATLFLLDRWSSSRRSLRCRGPFCRSAGSRPDWVSPSARIVQGLLIAYAVLWIVLTFDTLRLVRLVKVRPVARVGDRRRRGRAARARRAARVYGAHVDGHRRASTLGSIFGAGGPVVPPSDGYYNILLLGADSGEGRDSMRFDSISVVSVNADTGAVTITGIPRDMPSFPFAAGPDARPVPGRSHEGTPTPTCGWGGWHQPAPHRGRGVPRRRRALSRRARRTAPTPGDRGDEGCRGRHPRHRDPVLRLHRHARFRGARRRARRSRHQRHRAPAQGRRTRRTPGSPPTTGRSAGSRPARSTWTATRRSGTPARGTRRATGTGCCASASCRRRSSRSSRRERADALQESRGGGYGPDRHRPAAGAAAVLLRSRV